MVPVRAANIIDDWAKIEVPPPPELKSVTVDPETTALLVLDFTHQICNEEQQATKVEMVVNLRAAKTLGLTIPIALLGRADEVIE